LIELGGAVVEFFLGLHAMALPAHGIWQLVAYGRLRSVQPVARHEGSTEEKSPSRLLLSCSSNFAALRCLSAVLAGFNFSDLRTVVLAGLAFSTRLLLLPRPSTPHHRRPSLPR